MRCAQGFPGGGDSVKPAWSHHRGMGARQVAPRGDMPPDSTYMIENQIVITPCNAYCIAPSSFSMAKK